LAAGGIAFGIRQDGGLAGRCGEHVHGQALCRRIELRRDFLGARDCCPIMG
jgi:hypothetical protein